MSISKLIKLFWPLFLSGLVLVFTTQPIFHDGLFRTMDDIQVVRVEEMYKELISFQFPVRIASDLGNGAGYMLYNFYSPLVYYLGAIFHGLNFTLIISTKLTFLAAFLLAWLGIYLLLKSKLDTISAVFGSVIFLISPYLGYDAYHRGALAEFFAFCILPFLFYSYLKLSEKNSKLYLLASSLSIAVLVLSHNLTTMITLPFITAFILVCFRKNLIGFSSLLLGLSLSAFYWLPATLEKQYIIIDSVDFITKTYQNHFLTPLQLIGLEKIPWGFLPPVLGTGIFFGSVFAGLVLILQYLKLVSQKGNDLLFNFSVISFFISLFFASTFSKSIWELLSPPLNYLQFPWRFLTLATFFGTISCSYLIYKTKPLKDQIMVIVLLVVPLIVSYSHYFQPVGYNFISQYTADDPCGTAGWSNEYIPIWAKECFPKGSELEEVNVTKGDIKHTGVQIKNHSRFYQFSTESTESGKILFKKYYFPGWILKIDNNESSISAALPYGLIEANIPEGTHNIQLFFTNTPVRNIANIISLLSFMVWLIISFKVIKKLKDKHQTT